MPNLHRLIKKADLFGKRVNLRFEGEDYFKTHCGAVATIFLFLSLTLITTFAIYDILKGKINSMNYMIKNTQVTSKSEFNDRVEVFGFAIENKFLDKSFMNYDMGIGKRGEVLDSGITSYNCTEEVYSKLSVRFEKSVPKNLTITCMNVTSNQLRDGYLPTVIFKECLDVKKGCQSLKIRDKYLKEFYVWGFTVADETDFTKSKTDLQSNFTASLISVSNWYFKRATLVLREAELQLKTGLFVSRINNKFTNIYLRTELDIVSINKENENMLELNLKHDDTSKVVITKEFQSLSDLLAYLGGYSQGMMILMLILVFPVREISYYRKLINAMFSVCLNQRQLELAIKIFGSGDDDNSDDSKKGLKEKKRGSKGIIDFKRREERSKGSMFKDIQKIGQKFNKRRRKKTTRGALDQMMKERITKEKFLENMQKAFRTTETLQEMMNENKHNPKTPNTKSGFTLANLVLAGFGKYFKKKNKMPITISEMIEEDNGKISRGTQTFNIMDNFIEGKMRDLNIYEKTHLKTEVVVNGLGNWLKKVKKIAEEKEKVENLEEFEEEQKKRRKFEFNDFQNKRLMKKQLGNLFSAFMSPQRSLSNNSPLFKSRRKISINQEKIEEGITNNENSLKKDKHFKSKFMKEEDVIKTPKEKKFFGFRPNNRKIVNLSKKSNSFKISVKEVSTSSINITRTNNEHEIMLSKLEKSEKSKRSHSPPSRRNKQMGGKTFIKSLSRQIDSKKKKNKRKKEGILSKFELKNEEKLGIPNESGGGHEHQSVQIGTSERELGETQHIPTTERLFIPLDDDDTPRLSDSPIDKRKPRVQFSISPQKIDELTSNKKAKDVTSADEEHEKREQKLQKMQRKTEEMFEKSKDLKFNVTIMDYLRLFLPSFFDKNYTKKDLFTKVKKMN